MYEGQAAKVANTLLPRDKEGNLRSKTYRCPFGTIGQRTTTPTIKVMTSNVALAFAKLECPQAIKVQESVLISMVPEAVKAKLLSDPSSAEAFGFTVVEGGESITIKTLMETKDETK
jgi:hypothetical protein